MCASILVIKCLLHEVFLKEMTQKGIEEEKGLVDDIIEVHHRINRSSDLDEVHDEVWTAMTVSHHCLHSWLQDSL